MKQKIKKALANLLAIDAFREIDSETTYTVANVVSASITLKVMDTKGVIHTLSTMVDTEGTPIKSFKITK